jgi:hypothetical protein
MSPTTIYRLAVEKFLLRIRDHFQAHGTDLLDTLIECYPGNGVAVDSTGDLLRAMMAEGLIVQHHTPAPTFSQRVFDNSFGPGDAATRYFYFRGPNVLA